MQPSATQKPVMDVRAPKQPVAASSNNPVAPPSLTVHEAPASAEAYAPSKSAHHMTTEKTPIAKIQSPTINPAHSPLKPGPQAVAQSNAPTTAIVLTLIVMIVLSAVTITIYLNS